MFVNYEAREDNKLVYITEQLLNTYYTITLTKYNILCIAYNYNMNERQPHNNTFIIQETIMLMAG